MNCLRGLWLLLIISGTAANGQEMVLFRDTVSGFAISYPKKWKTTDRGHKSVAKFVASKRKNRGIAAIATLTISSLENPKPLDSIFSRYCIKMDDPVTSTGQQIINGKTYHWGKSVAENPWETIHSMFYLCKHEGKVVIIRFSTYAPERFSKYEELFLKMINSLVFVQK